MKSIAKTLCLFLCILLISGLLQSQVRNRKATVTFADGAEIDVTNWSWFYVEMKTPKFTPVPGFSGPPPAEPPKATKGKTKTSNVLMLSMRELVERGIYSTDMNISETQISSIEFKWTGNLLKAVVVSLLDGKRVEIPSLQPVAPYADLYFEGRATVNGFDGDFERKVSGIVNITSVKGTVVAIRFR